jgi:hypothetical protein
MRFVRARYKWGWDRWDVLPQPYLYPGVYALYYDGELRYIGSSKNLRRRLKWNQHPLLADLDFTRVRVKYKHTTDYLKLEGALITRLRPPLNRRNAPRVRPPLTRCFRRWLDE